MTRLDLIKSRIRERAAERELESAEIAAIEQALKDREAEQVEFANEFEPSEN